jgi:hypothetical protein
MVNGCVGSLTKPVRTRGIAVKERVGFMAELVNYMHRHTAAGRMPQFRQYGERLVNVTGYATGREGTAR